MIQRFAALAVVGLLATGEVAALENSSSDFERILQGGNKPCKPELEKCKSTERCCAPLVCEEVKRRLGNKQNTFKTETRCISPEQVGTRIEVGPPAQCNAEQNDKCDKPGKICCGDLVCKETGRYQASGAIKMEQRCVMPEVEYIGIAPECVDENDICSDRKHCCEGYECMETLRVVGNGREVKEEMRCIPEGEEPKIFGKNPDKLCTEMEEKCTPPPDMPGMEMDGPRKPPCCPGMECMMRHRTINKQNDKKKEYVCADPDVGPKDDVGVCIKPMENCNQGSAPCCGEMECVYRDDYYYEEDMDMKDEDMPDDGPGRRLDGHEMEMKRKGGKCMMPICIEPGKHCKLRMEDGMSKDDMDDMDEPPERRRVRGRRLEDGLPIDGPRDPIREGMIMKPKRCCKGYKCMMPPMPTEEGGRFLEGHIPPEGYGECMPAEEKCVPAFEHCPLKTMDGPEERRRLAGHEDHDDEMEDPCCKGYMCMKVEPEERFRRQLAGHEPPEGMGECMPLPKCAPKGEHCKLMPMMMPPDMPEGGGRKLDRHEGDDHDDEMNKCCKGYVCMPPKMPEGPQERFLRELAGHVPPEGYGECMGMDEVCAPEDGDCYYMLKDDDMMPEPPRGGDGRRLDGHEGDDHDNDDYEQEYGHDYYMHKCCKGYKCMPPPEMDGDMPPERRLDGHEDEGDHMMMGKCMHMMDICIKPGEDHCKLMPMMPDMPDGERNLAGHEDPDDPDHDKEYRKCCKGSVCMPPTMEEKPEERFLRELAGHTPPEGYGDCVPTKEVCAPESGECYLEDDHEGYDYYDKPDGPDMPDGGGRRRRRMAGHDDPDDPDHDKEEYGYEYYKYKCCKGHMCMPPKMPTGGPDGGRRLDGHEEPGMGHCMKMSDMCIKTGEHCKLMEMMEPPERRNLASHGDHDDPDHDDDDDDEEKMKMKCCKGSVCMPHMMEEKPEERFLRELAGHVPPEGYGECMPMDKVCAPMGEHCYLPGMGPDMPEPEERRSLAGHDDPDDPDHDDMEYGYEYYKYKCCEGYKCMEMPPPTTGGGDGGRRRLAGHEPPEGMGECMPDDQPPPDACIQQDLWCNLDGSGDAKCCDGTSCQEDPDFPQDGSGGGANPGSGMGPGSGNRQPPLVKQGRCWPCIPLGDECSMERIVPCCMPESMEGMMDMMPSCELDLGGRKLRGLQIGIPVQGICQMLPEPMCIPPGGECTIGGTGMPCCEPGGEQMICDIPFEAGPDAGRKLQGIQQQGVCQPLMPPSPP